MLRKQALSCDVVVHGRSLKFPTQVKDCAKTEGHVVDVELLALTIVSIGHAGLPCLPGLAMGHFYCVRSAVLGWVCMGFELGGKSLDRPTRLWWF